MSNSTKKTTAIAALRDLVADFLWYGRKDDEELSRDDVEGLFASGALTTREAVDAFADALREALPDVEPTHDPIAEAVRAAVEAERKAIVAMVERWHLDAPPSCGLRDMPGGAPPSQVFAAMKDLVGRIRARGAS